MGLRAQAERDLATTLEAQLDFGVSIVVTDPHGREATVAGQTTDIGYTIDPGTGLTVASRRASATLRLSTLEAAGFETIPENIPKNDAKPWRLQYEGRSYRVAASYPDRTLGVVTVILGIWQP